MASYETLADYANMPDTPPSAPVLTVTSPTVNPPPATSDMFWYTVGITVLVLIILYLLWANQRRGGSWVYSGGNVGATPTPRTSLLETPDYKVMLKESSGWSANVRPQIQSTIVSGKAATIPGWTSLGLASDFDECRAKCNNSGLAVMDSAIYFGATKNCIGRSI